LKRRRGREGLLIKKFRAKNLKQYVRINRTVGIGRPSFQALVCIIPERRRHWIRRIQIRLVAILVLLLGPEHLVAGVHHDVDDLAALARDEDCPWPIICT